MIIVIKDILIINMYCDHIYPGYPNIRACSVIIVINDILNYSMLCDHSL